MAPGSLVPPAVSRQWFHLQIRKLIGLLSARSRCTRLGVPPSQGFLAPELVVPWKQEPIQHALRNSLLKGPLWQTICKSKRALCRVSNHSVGWVSLTRNVNSRVYTSFTLILYFSILHFPSKTFLHLSLWSKTYIHLKKCIWLANNVFQFVFQCLDWLWFGLKDLAELLHLHSDRFFQKHN